jgi:4a-hydroxytetrahydrobiopterin dehydratase
MALQNEPFTEAPKATTGQIATLNELIEGWEVIEDGMPKLQKRYSFDTYAAALVFVNNVSVVAEELGHHPEITFTWGAATVRWWSHASGGLTLNDFIMAAKTDALLE